MHIANSLSLRQCALVLLALLLSLPGHALTLGRLQGAALIGRPLALAIVVTPDPGQRVGIECFEADVFHADSRQDPAGVQLRLLPGANPPSLILRVTSDRPVDEPVVTVQIRSVCAPALSRRFVLLADIVADPAGAVASTVAAAVVPLVEPPAAPRGEPGTGAQVPVSGAAGLGAAAAGASDAPAARRQEAAPRRPRPVVAMRKRPAKVAAARAAAVAPSKAARSAAAVPPQAVRTTGQSRLQLDPIEVPSDRGAMADARSAQAPLQTVADPGDAQRLASLESSVKALLAQAARNEARLIDLRGRLDRAQAERLDKPGATVLLALLLLGLAAIAYLLVRGVRRSREGARGSWWDGPAQQQVVRAQPLPAAAAGGRAALESGLSAMSEPSPLSQPTAHAPADRAPTQPTQPMTQPMTRPLAQAVAAGATPQVDVSLVELTASSFDRLMQAGAAPGAARRPATAAAPAGVPAPHVVPSAAPAPLWRRIDFDAEIDIRQRAEFFVSLGQTEQAVQVLKARIAQDGASCPQAFLDLLRLFHSLGLKADFEQVRHGFTRIFNAHIPGFADFGNDGLALEDYPGTVDRLVAVWDRSALIDVIEHLLYRQPNLPSPAPFDLAAFEDLLLLYAVAPAMQGATLTARPAPPSATGASSAQVDIDLSELFVEPATPAPSSGAPATALATGNLIDFDLTEVPAAAGSGAR